MPMPVVGEALLSGHVGSSDGTPVAGATILVAETDKKATADDTGAYQIMVPADSTVTLMASAAGWAATFRESVMLASQATISNFDFMMLTPEKVTTIGALGAPGKESTRGLIAIRLHSLAPGCVTAGAQITVWPPLAATVVYSRPASTSGGMDEPDMAMTGVQAGTTIQAWLAGTMPPGSGLVIDVSQVGCQRMQPSPSLQGMVFSGQRRVAIQALTEADLFLGSAS